MQPLFSCQQIMGNNLMGHPVYGLYGIPFNPLPPSAVDLRPYAHFGQLYKGLEKGAKRERESYATILHLSMYGVCDARACV